MGEWLDYSLADFLPFSPATYWRLFEQLNIAVWPLQVLLTGAAALAVFAAVRGWGRTGLLVGLCLAAFWGLVAQLFFTAYYAPINWAIEWATPFAWAQAALLILLAPGLRYGGDRRASWPPRLLVGLAFAYPAFAVAAGRPLAQAEIAGLAPDPTALLTIGLLWLARPNWRNVVLGVLPLVWITFSAATLLAMDAAEAWAPVMALWIAAFRAVRALVQRLRDGMRGR